MSRGGTIGAAGAVAVLGLVLEVGGCGGASQTISACRGLPHPAHARLPADVSNLLTKRQVCAALGNPTQISRDEDGRVVWSYTDRSRTGSISFNGDSVFTSGVASVSYSPAALPRCRARDLTLTGNFGVGGGNIIGTVTVTTVSPCKLEGFPIIVLTSNRRAVSLKQEHRLQSFSITKIQAIAALPEILARVARSRYQPPAFQLQLSNYCGHAGSSRLFAKLSRSSRPIPVRGDSGFPRCNVRGPVLAHVSPFGVLPR